ncbi:hypothetical protein [Flavobacterium wongokense]|uniref:hypothetical protein n=1 Tax=Flavobacterium wongokense TaxID=2910674 RepID=UPI001F19A51E|nr:hypothetical protein [Flavobacterium sp. WG47]MCF6131405.1 hypothetical protein [Flavobacterium sp. WG47]
MIVYDKQLLENTFLLEETKRLNDQGFVPKDQLTEIKKQLPVLKSHHNILIRIGFFILGCLLLSSLTGVISLITLNLAENHFWLMLFIYTAFSVVGSEILTKQQNQFGYGLDDAFILGFQGFFCGLIGVATESPLAAFIALAFVGLAACIRYVHTLSILVSLIGLTGAICYAVLELKIIGSVFLPFVLFVLALILYFVYVKVSTSKKHEYYANPLLLLQGFSLVLGYFSMNYMVVRELSESLLHLTIGKGQDIPFAFLFYGFTFLIPIFYIVYSLYSKDRLMLIIGFLTFGFSIYTIRFYYHILPIEGALLLGGILLFGGAYLAIRKLRDKETGLTFKPARGTSADILPNIEALIVNSQVDLKSMEPESKMPFGGGGFSGGGAGESF